jgi:hypothetical protein
MTPLYPAGRPQKGHQPARDWEKTFVNPDPLTAQDLDAALQAILADIQPLGGSVEVAVSDAAGRYAARPLTPR